MDNGEIKKELNMKIDLNMLKREQETQKEDLFLKKILRKKKKIKKKQIPRIMI